MAVIGPQPVTDDAIAEPGTVLHEVDQAAGYVASICFKTGPPTLVGVELEWTVHHRGDPARQLDRDALREALGPYAPHTLDTTSPHLLLPGGSAVTAEPGGQVELSSPPRASLAATHSAIRDDLRHVIDLLGRVGLCLGRYGIDAYRRPRQLLHTPRYDAMARSFDRRGPHGRTMMCSTAGLQVCLDAGTADRVASRWAAMHALGPVLLAAFANAPRHAGRPTGWASARMRSWLGIDPARSGPVPTAPGDPSRHWARYALAAPVLCVRRPSGSWHAPRGMTFADWVNGALPGRPPTVDDLDYHLTTLFPPVRPRGYVELRYLDAQPPAEWLAPVAVLAALLADESIVDSALDRCAPMADRWLTAARAGLADPALARIAAAVLDLACGALDRTDLGPRERAEVAEIVGRRLARGRGTRSLRSGAVS